jgi:hypothetical protein
MTDKIKLIPQVASSATPTLLRARYVHSVVDAVNRNTLAIRPPENVKTVSPERQFVAAGILSGNVDRSENADTGELEINDLPMQRITWHEIRRLTSTVRVENPDDEEQFVDVLRIDSVLFVTGDGSVAELRFNNPAE